MRLAALVLSMIAAFPAAAAEYFILQNGAGSQNGTSLANACNGLADADCNATPASGSVIRLCGTLTPSATWGVTTANTVVFDGDCSAYGYPRMATIQNSGGGYNMNWQGSGNATFRNIDFAGQGPTAGSFDDCVNIDGSGTVKLERVRIHNCHVDAVDVDVSTAKVTLTNSYISDSPGYGFQVGGAGTPQAATVTYNLFEDTGTLAGNTDAISIVAGVPASEIGWNEVSRTKTQGFGAGIAVADTSSANTVVHYVHNNYVHDCANNGYGITTNGTSSALVVANWVVGCGYGLFARGTTAGSNQNFYYNAVFGQGLAGFRTGSGSAAQSVNFVGNLVVEPSTVYLFDQAINASSFTSNYNFFSGGSGFRNLTTGSGCTTLCDLTGWRVGGYDANSKTASVPPILGGLSPRTIFDLTPVPGGAMWLAGKTGADPAWRDLDGCPFDRWTSNIGPVQICAVTPSPARANRN